MQFTVLLSLVLANLLTLTTACVKFDGTYYAAQTFMSGRIREGHMQVCTISKVTTDEHMAMICGEGFAATIHRGERWTVDYEANGNKYSFDINAKWGDNTQFINDITLVFKAENYGC